MAQAGALVLAGYVLVGAYQSPQKDAPVRWVTVAVTVVAVGWIAFLLVKAPLHDIATS